MTKTITDRYGNPLFHIEPIEGHQGFYARIAPDVQDVTKMCDLTLYSSRATEELKELLETMMADTGH